MVPSAGEYKRHQAEQGHVPLTAVGGLYFRCFLKEYIHVGTGFSARQVFSAPVTYHGAPFGAFRRAFAVLGLPGVEALSVPVIQQLTVLKNLYFLQEDVETLGLKGEDSNPPAPSNPYAQRFGFPPSFPDNSQNISAAGMPSEFTAGQPTIPFANHASNIDDAGLPAMPSSPCSPQRFADCRPPLGPRVDDASPPLLDRESPQSPKALADIPRGWNCGDRGVHYPPIREADISDQEQFRAEIPEGHNAVDELRHDTFNNMAIGSLGKEHSEQGYNFILGPKMTTNDVIDRYRPVLCTSSR